MTDTLSAPWVLRWDTQQDEKPSVLRCGASAGSVAETGWGDLAAFDGYLFDRAELERRPGTPAAELVLEAYRRWGEDLCDKLRGAFTLGLWDDDRQLLLVGRDGMGLNPCFYRWDGRMFLMSPSLDAILAQPGVEARVDRVVMAEYIQNTLASHQVHETFYEGIRRLPSAHVLSLRRGQLTTRRYWDPVPPGFAWASLEEMSGFSAVLERAVGRCVAAGADCLALSGGFDSIGLAALAAGRAPGRHPLHALSLRFVDTPCDEGESQAAVARGLGMPLLLLPITESLGGRSLVDASVELSERSHCPVLSLWQALYAGLLRAAADLGLKGLMMGTGGDEMLAVDVSYAADCLAAGRLRELGGFYVACRQTSSVSTPRLLRAVLWRGAIRPELGRRARSLLGLVAPTATERLRQRRRAQAAIRPWLSNDPALRAALQERACHPIPVELGPGEGSYVRAIRHLPQAPLMQLELEQGGSFTGRFGLPLFLPYLDRDLVDLLLRIRPEHLIDGGYHKAPLRRLVSERLPMVDPRAKKMGFGRMAHDVLRSQGRAAWRDLGGPQRLGELGLVRGDLVQSWMDQYFVGRQDDALQAWLFLSAEMWLRARSMNANGGSSNEHIRA
jgi:asparagine synthase (glutamine-hydrolysing)